MKYMYNICSVINTRFIGIQTFSKATKSHLLKSRDLDSMVHALKRCFQKKKKKMHKGFKAS